MAKKAIEIKDLSFSYPDGTKALSDINLDVFEGEALGIIGPNGAGKSTLLLHLNGILRGNGNIKIFDLELKYENLPKIRSKVGFVFQDPDNQLFMSTVFDDVAFGPLNMGMDRNEIESSVIEVLRKVDMLDSIKKMPHHLSFGEKRKVSFATVLSMNPEILVLDEPSSNLDPKGRRELINLLKDFKLTKVVATHDLEFALEVCSKAALIDKGRLFARGEILSLFRDKPLLEAHSLEIPPALS